MNTDPCSSVLLTCKSLSGGQGYFHREDANSAKKSDFKDLAFFASSRWIFGVAAGLHCVHLWFRFSIRSHWRGGMYLCHHIPDETCRENRETGHQTRAAIRSSATTALGLVERLVADCVSRP